MKHHHQSQIHLFSLKVLVHKVSLTRLAFRDGKDTLLRPFFKVKLVDFPVVEIKAKRNLMLVEFSTKERIQQTMRRTQTVTNNPFGNGKAVVFKAKQTEVVDYLKNYSLIVQMKHYLVDEPDNPVIYTVGKVHVDMDEFLGDITCPIPVEIERFRRNTFQLTNKENECVGWVDMSISLLQRPAAYLMKPSTIHDSDAINITIPLGSPKEQIPLEERYQIASPSNNPRLNLSVNSSYQQQQLQPTRAAGGENRTPLNSHLHNSSMDDVYGDDFEQSQLGQSSSAHKLANISKLKFKNSGSRIGFDDSDVGTERYDEDFDSMSVSHGFSTSMPKRTGSVQTPIEKKKSFQQYDQNISRIHDDAISEVYTEDFESMSLSQSIHKPTPKNKPLIRR